MTSSVQLFIDLLLVILVSFSNGAYSKKKISYILERDSISMFKKRLEGNALKCQQLLSLDGEIISDYLFSMLFSIF